MSYQFEFNQNDENNSRLFTSLIKQLNSEYSNQKHSKYANPNSILSVSELRDIINRRDIELIAVKNNQDYKEYIPDSSLISIDDITTTVNGIPGLIADKEQIENILSKKGIRNEDTIIIYDQNQSLYAARLWWTLKAYGHDKIKILDGGINEWRDKGYETLAVPKIEKKSVYNAEPLDDSMIATLSDIKKTFSNKNKHVLDVRSLEEYKAGHIPGAVHNPWSNSMNEEGMFKSREKLDLLYRNKGITKDLDKVYTQCLKGVRASHTYFVLTELLGYGNVKVYDGSWAEYSKSGLPIEKD